MKTTCLALAAALLCAPALATAAPATTLSPEQTFDLYARVLLEDDAAAARTLNDALRPAFDGQDAVTPTPGGLAAAMAAPLQALLAKSGDTSGGSAVPALLSANLHNTHCRADQAQVRDNASVARGKIAAVGFTCQVTALDGLRPLFEAAVREDSSANLTRFTDAYLAALRDGPRQAVRGSLDLYPAGNGAGWHSANLDDLVAPVVNALLPFAVWSQEAAALEAPKVTGVPGCDLLLQQHRSCLARTAPDQVPGVDAMAEELKAKAKVMTPEAMTRECKALRSMAEAMWGDDCG